MPAEGVMPDLPEASVRIVNRLFFCLPLGCGAVIHFERHVNTL